MTLNGQEALCGEVGDAPWPYCGRPAVAPHPGHGYARPLCRMHLDRIANLSNTKPAQQCDVTACTNPSVWVDVGDAGDFYLCREHMRP